MASATKYFLICAVVLLCFAQIVQPRTIVYKADAEFFDRLGKVLKDVVSNKDTVKELWDNIGGAILPNKWKDLGDIAGKLAGII